MNLNLCSEVFEIRPRIWSAAAIEKLVAEAATRLVVDPNPGDCACQQHGRFKADLSRDDFEDNNNLPQLYETNRVADLFEVRAEKYDSPENRELLKAWQRDHPEATANKVPRNQLNPNYSRLLSFIRRLRYNAARTATETELRQHNLPLLRQLREFITVKLELAATWAAAPAVINHWSLAEAGGDINHRAWWALLDVRWCRTPQDVFDYLYHRYVRRDCCRKLPVANKN